MMPSEMAAEMKQSADRAEPVQLRVEQAEAVGRSVQLFHILVMMVKGRALEILESIGERGKEWI